jgi:hypothetical protein
LLRKPLQKKLSSLLGMEVRLGEVKLSLMKGTLDVRDVLVLGAGGETVLTVERVKAEVSVAGVFKKEIAVKSLAIERPRLAIVQDGAGRLNVLRPAEDEPDAPPEVKGSGWKLDARRVLLVDGEVSFRSEHGKLAGWEVALRKVLGELKRVDDGFDLTAIVESVAELGSLHATGKLTAVESLADLSRGSLVLNVELAGLKAKLESPSLASKRLTATVDGSVHLPTWLRVAPAGALGGLGSIGGTVGIKGGASFDPVRGVRVSEMDLTVRELVVPP